MIREPYKQRSAAPQWALVATLTVVTMLAQIDKNILVLMVGPIQRDFGVGDIQISYLIGAAFAVSNIAVGLPAGWLADRYDRRVIVAVGVLVWSVAVAANAAASAFVALVVARVIVGGAEALIPPSSYSLIRDGIDDQRRARALSVYTMALMLGTGLSLVLGGPMMGWIQSAGLRAIPLIGDVAAWQMTLFLIGIVGLPVGLLIFLNRDPGRNADATHSERPTTKAVFRYLADRKSLFLPLLVFAVANAMITYGLGAWMPTMTARRFHLGMGEIGLIQGGLLLTMGPLGLWLAGMAMDAQSRANRLSGVAIVGIVVSVAVPSLTVLLCMTDTLIAFWLVDAMVVLFSWTFMAVASTIVTRVVPPNAVGLVMAIVLVLNGLIGQGLSPTLIALAGRHVFDAGRDALPHGMALVFACAGVLAVTASAWMYRALLHREAVAVAEMAVTPAHIPSR
ncbi:MFS transporter [Cupriavidus sp. D39]|uniref:MFS transporter n=1 Tax=Cupriavidus sp. D39 TaxID=2997877 RepID=UPI00226F7B2E|nr:MFS transporter [Cupriavidus sp. D39]MCY0854103.1 MFS transporter [Cupriavidus sp. D39]